MKKSALLLIASIFFFSSSAFAGQVQGYYRKDGTYVQPHWRSNPNGTVTDNYSYQGNTNPYTGHIGTNRYEHDTTSPYYSGPDSQGRSGHSNNSLYGGYQSGYR